jgi:hypothetical protein
MTRARTFSRQWLAAPARHRLETPEVAVIASAPPGTEGAEVTDPEAVTWT